MYFWRLILNMKVTCLFCIFSCFNKCFFSILKWWHRHDGHLYSCCLLYIFTFCCKCLPFQFLGYGIGMKWITGWTNGHNLLKNILFRLNFQDEGKLYANCLYYILSFYVTCILFQFLGCGIGTHISILKRVQNGWIYTWKAMILC